MQRKETKRNERNDKKMPVYKYTSINYEPEGNAVCCWAGEYKKKKPKHEIKKKKKQV